MHGFVKLRNKVNSQIKFQEHNGHNAQHPAENHDGHKVLMAINYNFISEIIAAIFLSSVA